MWRTIGGPTALAVGLTIPPIWLYSGQNAFRDHPGPGSGRGPQGVDGQRSGHGANCARNAFETRTRENEPKPQRLRGLRRPQYRLRVGEVRVFYDVSGATVEILAIVAKSEAKSWLAQFGSPE
jgi:mRNA interferase RelE/StbE